MKYLKKYKGMWILLSVILLLAAAILIFINQPSFGSAPKGERLVRVQNSPNYRDGQFRNLRETPQLTSGKGYVGTMIDFLFRTVDNLRPAQPVPAIHTNLHELDRNEDMIIWLGHGSYLLQADGKRMLVDPVFRDASPISFYNKAFPGADIYQPEDIPEIDYLVISHDHWDHLDYKTVKEMKGRTCKVVCPLGVGEHFEQWGYKKENILEMDWNEEVTPDKGFTFYCLPARHFSGRGFKPNQSLWASFLLQTPTQKIFIGGDGGYDTHFKEIHNRFAPIDLAILENGQYDMGWKYIHLLPDDLVQAIKDLQPERVLTVHHAKYALGKHAWDEPLNQISEAAQRDSFNLLTPMIGEVIYLKQPLPKLPRWWETK